jgi:hypothetical protein
MITRSSVPEFIRTFGMMSWKSPWRAIEHPERQGIRCVKPFAVRLDNDGTIASVANGKGGRADKQSEPTKIG